jgi:hypothetical protein
MSEDFASHTAPVTGSTRGIGQAVRGELFGDAPVLVSGRD